MGSALAIFTLLASAGANSATRPAPSTCRMVSSVGGIGRACLRQDGMYEIIASDGRSLGLTHGPDTASSGASAVASTAGSSESSGAPSPVTCVTAGATNYYIQVVYARAFDDADDYEARKETIRNLVASAATYVRDASLVAGSFLTLRVACSGGAVHVARAVLSTRKASASFRTITSDLKAYGYTSKRVKYWVYYDDPAVCQCGGMANVFSDDRPTIDNQNNGNAGPMFAVNFGRNDSGVMLHELSHTLGAVQHSAPHKTGGYHCTDGRDVMCFNDGGSNGSQYTTNACATYVYDCGKDDYFNRNPVSGSYLAKRWNLASPNNRFMQMRYDSTPPVLQLNDPAQKTTYFGCQTRQPGQAQEQPVFVGTGCVRGSATDAETGIAKIDLIIDGQVRESVFNTGTFSFQPSRLSYNLSSGQHSVGVAVTNAAGLQFVRAVSVTWA